MRPAERKSCPQIIRSWRGMCESEVKDFEASIWRKAKVAGLKIAVDDALFVRRGQSLRQLSSQGGDFF